MNPQELNKLIVLIKSFLVAKREKKSPDQLNDKDKLLEESITRLQECEIALNAYHNI